MQDELRFHFDREVERHRAAGLSRRDAEYAARLALGNLGAAQDAMREATNWTWLARVQMDLRFAIRSLSHTPAFSLTVVGTIALALGLNTMVFTIFDAYVLRPLQVRDPGALHGVAVTGRTNENSWTDWSLPWDRYLDVAGLSGVVSDAVAYRRAFVRIDRMPTIGQLVSGNYFQALGVRVERGRPLLPEDVSVPGDGAVAVISHAMWVSRFGSDSGVVGRTLPIRGRPFIIVGVAAPAFTGLTEVAADFWAPVTMAAVIDGESSQADAGGWPAVNVVVRLGSGIGAQEATAAIGLRLLSSSRDSAGATRVTGARLQSRATLVPMTAEDAAMLTPIWVAFGLVLVIACANVANMMLARGLARQREIGIRLALGAGRRHVVGQLLVEALVLAIPAAALGFLVSRVALAVGVDVMMATFPPSYASFIRPVEMRGDLRVFAFMLTGAVAAAVLFGLAPALQVTRPDPVAATRGESEGGMRQGRLRNFLVIAQMAGCTLLLIVSGVLMRGATRALVLDPGFRAGGVVHLEVNDAQRRDVLTALHRFPIVEDVASTTNPARGLFGSVAVSLLGTSQVRPMYFTRVSPTLFETLQMPLREGRTFTEVEATDRLSVVVLSESAARLLAPGRSAIGSEVRLGSADATLAQEGLADVRTAKVVGVVADAVAGIVLTRRDVPIAYYPADVATTGSLLVAVRGSVATAARALETALERELPGSVTAILPLEESVAAQIYPVRAASWVATLLGAVALVLTVSGMYGVLAYLVAQRTREFGIRMSLGARRGVVVREVMGQSLRLAAVGIPIGLANRVGDSSHLLLVDAGYPFVRSDGLCDGCNRDRGGKRTGRVVAVASSRLRGSSERPSRRLAMALAATREVVRPAGSRAPN
ncbi:MAG: hypothetical protein MNPFHGCM_02580 [Gemmatimonadaceae bacterium]|nr:hypothetical protein [Gemmatimonadaceae bacterium]